MGALITFFVIIYIFIVYILKYGNNTTQKGIVQREVYINKLFNIYGNKIDIPGKTQAEIVKMMRSEYDSTGKIDIKKYVSGDINARVYDNSSINVSFSNNQTKAKTDSIKSKVQYSSSYNKNNSKVSTQYKPVDDEDAFAQKDYELDKYYKNRSKKSRKMYDDEISVGSDEPIKEYNGILKTLFGPKDITKK